MKRRRKKAATAAPPAKPGDVSAAAEAAAKRGDVNGEAPPAPILTPEEEKDEAYLRGKYQRGLKRGEL